MKSPLLCEIVENRMKGTVSLGKQFGYYKEYRKKLAGISTHAIVTSIVTGSIYMLSSDTIKVNSKKHMAPIELTPLNCLHYLLGLSQKVEAQSRVKDKVRKLSSLQLCMQLNDPRPNFGYEPVDSSKNDSGNIWDYSDKGAAPCTCFLMVYTSQQVFVVQPFAYGYWKVYLCYCEGNIEKKLADSDVSEEDQNNLLRSLDNKESEYMRLQMHKMGVDDFELLTMIGNGAFGEVIVLGGDWDHRYFYWGAYCILRLQAQKMYGNTWTEIAKVVSGTNKENNVADMNTNKGKTTNGILLNYNPKGERFLIASHFPTLLRSPEASPAIVEPLRIELPFLEDQFQEDPPEDPPEVPMADNRTMAELLQAPTECYEDVIVIPKIVANNFELKHGLINLVQIKQFFGLDKEDLHAHIRYFNKITSTMRSFYEAWGRFNDLLRACPHYGFFELHQLDTFYNALNVNDQDSLNFAAGGNFLDKMPRECLKIIKSKSKVHQSRAKAVIAKVCTSSSTPAISSDVAELKDMVRELLLDKKN
uniref:Serine/threonine-protein kinase 38-like n=1 Tax=Tanacetum cinerariifolium TaxID=118510 RepID=A0A699HID3_TANCI|nr:serine/threonine-protein kinase 38-like [Tanacetum cinerariifolium]